MDKEQIKALIRDKYTVESNKIVEGLNLSVTKAIEDLANRGVLRSGIAVKTIIDMFARSVADLIDIRLKIEKSIRSSIRDVLYEDEETELADEMKRSVDSLENMCRKRLINHDQKAVEHMVAPVFKNLKNGIEKQISILKSELQLEKESAPGVVYTNTVEISVSLEKFQNDYPEPNKVAFIMMQYGTTEQHGEIVKAIKDSLKEYDITALRADDKYYADDLFPNIKTYMHGCGIGIAVFEKFENNYFNPNVSLEVGYMLALNKSICYLKDESLDKLPSDLTGKLYRNFDPARIKTSVKEQLVTWLKEKDFID